MSTVQPPYNQKELFALISRNDEHAFRMLFDEYRKKIYSFALYLTHSEFLAEEIVQDVFQKIWIRRSELSAIDYPAAWIKTIARNTASNYLKRIAHEKLIMLELRGQVDESQTTAEENLQWKEYHEVLQRAINNLSPQLKKVYLMSRQENMKNQEIADALGISLYTVKEYLKKSLLSIRTALLTHAELSILAALNYFFI
ncbi:MAG: RNA polymerase sigma-70 factor [Chitinophagaceae bacterium]|nr:RNA polymerase sigma-70 factor [Chitinophagaceae bacterium]